MNRLRMRLSLLLVGSIMAAVVLATALLVIFVSLPIPSRMIPSLGHQILAMEDMQRGDTPRVADNLLFANQPAAGQLIPDLTRGVADFLRQKGFAGEVRVTQAADGGVPVASVAIENGRWIVADFPESRPPPTEMWLVLGAWLVIVTIGVLITSIVLANRMTRPFDMMEEAIASVGRDGVLPKIPVTGTGEMRETAHALNRLSDRLSGAMESRMRLVAAAGHDLRTPMTRMRLRAEFLPEDDRQSWMRDLEELDLIADSAIRLVREEAAGQDEETVRLDVLVRETVDELVASGLELRLDGAQPAQVVAGPLSLRRAVRNILTNAATHGGGGAVRLDTGGGEARLVVEDDGPGIPDDLLSRVFEPFFRAAPGRTQTVPGAGLGLAIAREIVERFGGSITIANRAQGGLRQVVVFALEAHGA